METTMTTEEMIERVKETVVPVFDRKYTKRQGPASMKKSTAGRTFSASGPKADLIARLIFADLGFTRSKIADLVGCSPSRVSEVIWALDNAVDKGQIDGYPEVPRSTPVILEVTATEVSEPKELPDNLVAALEASINEAKAARASENEADEDEADEADEDEEAEENDEG